MTVEVATLFIAILGTATVYLSIKAALRFRHKSKQMGGDTLRLTKALKWQLYGEAVIGLGTLTFAMAAWSGHLTHWPQLLQTTIRFVMFFATSATTWHLNKTIDRLEYFERNEK